VDFNPKRTPGDRSDDALLEREELREIRRLEAKFVVTGYGVF
jgi:hypothetical protein